METLEQYAQFQAAGSDYDFEANLTLIKLYQFEPNRVNITVTLQVLLKALVNMPTPDFSLLKSVLPPNLQQDEKVKQVVSLHDLLESCQFREVWVEGGMGQVTENITDFQGQIRQYICSVLEVSYQSVPTQLVRDYLGGLEDSSLSQLAGGRGWVVAGETVHIRKQEELIKPKKILAKIDMDSVSGILSAAIK